MWTTGLQGFETLSFDFMGADLSDKFLGISMGISMGSYPRVNGTRCGKAMGKDTRKMNYKWWILMFDIELLVYRVYS